MSAARTRKTTTAAANDASRVPTSTASPTTKQISNNPTVNGRRVKLARVTTTTKTRSMSTKPKSTLSKQYDLARMMPAHARQTSSSTAEVRPPGPDPLMWPRRNHFAGA